MWRAYIALTSRGFEACPPFSCRMCYIRKINMLIEGLPVLDAGSFGESRGAGTHSQACEGPEHPPGAAAAEDYRASEGPAN